MVSNNSPQLHIGSHASIIASLFVYLATFLFNVFLLIIA